MSPENIALGATDLAMDILLAVTAYLDVIQEVEPTNVNPARQENTRVATVPQGVMTATSVDTVTLELCRAQSARQGSTIPTRARARASRVRQGKTSQRKSRSLASTATSANTVTLELRRAHSARRGSTII